MDERSILEKSREIDDRFLDVLEERINNSNIDDIETLMKIKDNIVKNEIEIEKIKSSKENNVFQSVVTAAAKLGGSILSFIMFNNVLEFEKTGTIRSMAFKIAKEIRNK